jgi:hypothetical protein
MLKKILMGLFLYVATVQSAGELKFQGFDHTFLNFGEYVAGFYEFELKVDNSPYHFIYRGKMNAGTETSDLPLLEEDLVFVVSYFDDPITDASGVSRQFAIHEIFIFLEDEELKVKELSVELLPPYVNQKEAKASLVSVPLKQKAYEASKSQADREGIKEEGLILASADPWNKELLEMKLLAMQEQAEKRRVDSLARLIRAETPTKVAPAIAPPKKLVRKKVLKKVPEPQAESEVAPPKKLVKKKVLKRKVVKPAEPTVEPVKETYVARPVKQASEPDWAVRKAKANDAAKASSSKDQTRKYQGYASLGAGSLLAILTYLAHSDVTKYQTARNDAQAGLDIAIANGDPGGQAVFSAAVTENNDLMNSAGSKRTLFGVLSAATIGAGVYLLYF